MRKFIVFVGLLFFALFLCGSAVYYSDGSFVKMTRAAGLSSVVQDARRFQPLPDEVLRLNMGGAVFSVVMNEKGDLPVYYFKDMPVIAERTVFYRGSASVSYIEEKYGVELVEILSSYSLYVFNVKQGDSVKIAAEIVENGDGYAFPNLVREVALNHIPKGTPEDPYFDVQWHLQNTGSVRDYYGNVAATLKNADIKFIDAMKLLESEAHAVDDTVKIAIMDTGIVPDHPDLTNIEPGYDALLDKEGGYPDTSGIDDLPWYAIGGIAHGTTCAGVSAAVGNNIGMTGVCPWCDLYPVRYLEAAGTAMDDRRLLKVYEKYVADPKIAVINCSFGPPSEYGMVPVFPGEIESHENFMKNGRNGLGGAIVYASGNDGVDVEYTLLHSYIFTFKRNGKDVSNKVVSVGASTAWDTRAVYSNYGSAVDVVAPSLSQVPMIGMATTTIPGYGDYQKDYTLLFSGTSAAAPVVSGLMGTIFSVNPELTLEEAVDILKMSADKVHPYTGGWDKNGHSIKYGYGRVNLYKATRLAMGLPMCENPPEKDICGNHIDDNCDGFVDSGCEFGHMAGKECEEDSDCVSEGFPLNRVACLKTLRYWKFDDGYCVIKTGDSPCPDGTRAFAVDDTGSNYICALDCTPDKPCERDGYYCRGDSLGVCVPSCVTSDDCSEGSYCSPAGECTKIPSGLGGSCGNDSECEDNMWCLTNFRDGYCTSNCAMQDDTFCPDGGKCVVRRAGGSQTIEICLESCASDSHCRQTDDDYYICHAKMSEKEGVCFRKCRNDADCMDVYASCNEEGRCIPDNWKGWPEDEVVNDDEETDTDDDSDEDTTEDDPLPEEDKKKSGGCSIHI